MGNSNKSKLRSTSNPQLREEQHQIDKQQPQENKISENQEKPAQVKQLTQENHKNTSQQPFKKQENSTQKSQREKRVSSEHDQRTTKNQRYGDVRQSHDSPPSKTIKVFQNTGSGGKKRKSLEDIMISEIQKLKKQQPQKNMPNNQVQSMQNYKNRVQNQVSVRQNNYPSTVKFNQSSQLMNHIIAHSRSNSPQQKNRLKTMSPDSSILSKSKIFIPQVPQLSNSELQHFDGLEVISSIKLMQCKKSKKDIKLQDKSSLFRSQTNPKKRDNSEVITKNFSATNRNNNFLSSNNKTFIVNTSKTNQNNGYNNLIFPEMRSIKNSDLANYPSNNALPQLNEQNKGNFQTNQQNESIPKHTPRRIEELFSIYDGGKRKISYDKNRDKNQSQLVQITSYLDKKYQTSSKKKAEFEKIQPYIRSNSQSNNNNTISPRQPSSSKIRKDILMPMFIVQTPQQNQEEQDFEKYCNPNSFLNTKQSFQKTQSTKNAIQIKNKFLRTQLANSTIRSKSSHHQENVKHLSKLRYQKPYQIEFDQQQYDILNKSNVNNSKNDHIKFNEYLKECQFQQQQDLQNNTFYSKKSQSFYDGTFEQSKILLTNQENSTVQMNQSKIQNNQLDNEQNSNQISKNDENKSSNYYSQIKRDTTENQDLDQNLKSFIDQSNYFQETNSYHLNMGYDRMKIRKYQNNSQIGILSNTDIQKIYMKNPVLDVYTSTLKQSQRLNQNIQKNNSYIHNNSQLMLNPMNTSNVQFIKFGNQNQSMLSDNKEYQKLQLIQTYQPKKSRQNKQKL